MIAAIISHLSLLSYISRSYVCGFWRFFLASLFRLWRLWVSQAILDSTLMLKGMSNIFIWVQNPPVLANLSTAFGPKKIINYAATLSVNEEPTEEA